MSDVVNNSRYWVNYRWLLLIIIPVGYIFTKDLYTRQLTEYFLLNTISFLFLILLLWSMRQLRKENIVLFITLLVLLFGYYIKFYYLSSIIYNNISDFEIQLFFGRLTKDSISAELLYKSFYTLVVVFSLFSISSMLLLAIKRPASVNQIYVRGGASTYEAIALKLLLAAVIIGLFAGYLRWYYQLGIFGVQANLPYKLAGIINTTNVTIVPSLIGVALCYSVYSGNTKIINKIIIFFLLWGVIQFIFFPSKTSLITPVLWIILVSFSFNRMLIAKKYIVILLICFALLYPLLNIYRSLLHDQSREVVLSLLSDTLESGAAVDTADIPVVLYALMSIVSRVVGFGELMVLTDIRSSLIDFSLLDYLVSGKSAGTILTEAVGIEGTGVASSLLGQTYYATGSNYMTGLLVSLWTVLAYIVSRLLLSKGDPFFLAVWVLWIISVTMWIVDELSVFKIVLFLVTCFYIYITKIMVSARTF